MPLALFLVSTQRPYGPRNNYEKNSIFSVWYAFLDANNGVEDLDIHTLTYENLALLFEVQVL